MTDDSEIAKHYRKQAARLRRMALFLPGAELKANLRNATRMYEGLAEKLTQRRCTLGGDPGLSEVAQTLAANGQLLILNSEDRELIAKLVS